MDRVYLSTVTPVYRGERYLRRLVDEVRELREALDRDGLPVEIVEAIFVDDSSVDGSAGVLAELAAAHAWIKVVSLSRNFGQHPATVAGVLHSSGDWVATLDEDLQHRPRLLVDLLARAADESWDLVYAEPRGAVHGASFRDAASRLYKRFASWVAANPQIRKFNSFRMIRGSVARAAAAVSSRSTYFDVALCWFTDRVPSLPLPLKELRAETERWCADLLEKSPTALALAKQSFNIDSEQRAGVAQFAHTALNLYYGTAEALEGRNAFVEKRPVDFAKFRA